MKALSHTTRLSALIAATLMSVSSSALAQHIATGPAADVSTEMTVEKMMGETVDAKLAAAIETAIADGMLDEELGGELAPGVIVATRAAYAQKMFKPIWSLEGADSLIATRGDLISYGIIADDVLPKDVTELAHMRFQAHSAEKRARADIKMTAAWLRIAAAVSGGLKDEGRAESTPTKRPTPMALTQSIIDAGQGGADTELKAFESNHPQYIGLKESLAHYRDIRATGGWLAIPDGDAIERGDTDKRVPALRKRLLKEGYDAPQPVANVIAAVEEVIEGRGPVDADQIEEIITEDMTTFDEGLENALRAFQRRHGLEDDGILGRRTLDALNESPESKIDRIADTMHRWRQYGDMGDRYIWANIPSYMAEGWSNGAREIRMRTIVGMRSRATPTFSDEIEYAVANPKWYAPVSIVRRDKLPKLADDPAYATRKNFKVYDRETGQAVSPYEIDWTDPASAEAYRLVQSSGDNNALGEMKIIFPNQYSIYLHGTPGKSLFDKAQRAFSSGCIRLENPEKMAQWLSQYDEEVSPDEIKSALDSDDNTKLVFKQRTPVHITYMTVTISDSGQPMFWRDVYKKGDGIAYVKKYAKLYTPPEKLTTALLPANSDAE